MRVECERLSEQPGSQQFQLNRGAATPARSIFEPLHPIGGTAFGHAFGLALENNESALGEIPVEAISQVWMPAGHLVQWRLSETDLKLPSDEAEARLIGLRATPDIRASSPAGLESALVTPVPTETAPKQVDQSA